MGFTTSEMLLLSQIHLKLLLNIPADIIVTLTLLTFILIHSLFLTIFRLNNNIDVMNSHPVFRRSVSLSPSPLDQCKYREALAPGKKVWSF